MNSRAFLSDELQLFIRHFPQTRVRYEFDEDAMVHIIEVVPNEVYCSSSKYIDWENDLFDRFIALFPTENICFISDDALVGIGSAELVLGGLEYPHFTGATINSCS